MLGRRLSSTNLVFSNVFTTIKVHHRRICSRGCHFSYDCDEDRGILEIKKIVGMKFFFLKITVHHFASLQNNFKSYIEKSMGKGGPTFYKTM